MSCGKDVAPPEKTPASPLPRSPNSDASVARPGDPIVSGQIHGERVACSPRSDRPGRFDCVSGLRSFLRARSDTRIAGISPFYREGQISPFYRDRQSELLVWITESSVWPRAKDLEIDERECPGTSQAPDCSAAIAAIAAAATKHRYFIVPIFGTLGQPRTGGSWSFLDVYRIEGETPADAGWDHVRAVTVPCRVAKGEPSEFESGGYGVVKERVTDVAKSAEEGPGSCKSALINFLRAHPGDRILGVVGLDGMRTPSKGDDLPDPETLSLLVLMSDDAKRSSAEWLAVDQSVCFFDGCPAHLAEPNLGQGLARSVAVASIATGDAQAKTVTATLLWVWRLPE